MYNLLQYVWSILPLFSSFSLFYFAFHFLKMILSRSTHCCWLVSIFSLFFRYDYLLKAVPFNQLVHKNQYVSMMNHIGSNFLKTKKNMIYMFPFICFAVFRVIFFSLNFSSDYYKRFQISDQLLLYNLQVHIFREYWCIEFTMGMTNFNNLFFFLSTFL